MIYLLVSILCCIPSPEMPIPDILPSEAEAVISRDIISRGFTGAGVAWEEIVDGKRRCYVGYQSRDYRDPLFSGSTYREALAKYYQQFLNKM